MPGLSRKFVDRVRFLVRRTSEHAHQWSKIPFPVMQRDEINRFLGRVFPVQDVVDPLKEVIETCEGVLKGIFLYPRMYGTPQMVETTFLNYLGILLIAKGVNDTEETSFYLQWVDFINRKLPGTPIILGLADRFEWETDADWGPFLAVMKGFLDSYSDALEK